MGAHLFEIERLCVAACRTTHYVQLGAGAVWLCCTDVHLFEIERLCVAILRDYIMPL